MNKTPLAPTKSALPARAMRSALSLAALAALIAPATSAWSQAAPVPDAAASAPAAQPADAPAVQSVTVTGNGRAQVLQSVPIALQVVTSEQIDKLAASNLGDLNGYIPGLQVNADQPTRPIAIYDTIVHRVIHSRLYTVTKVPVRFDYMRMDDYLVMYIGSSAEGKEALQK